MPLHGNRRTVVVRGATALAALPLAGFAFVTPAQAATTVTVAADGSGNYTTIQAALGAVSAGSVINIKPGTYRGQVSIPAGKSGVTLQGTSGTATDVVITGNAPASTAGTSGSATVLNLAGNTTVKGLTIANTYAAHDSQALALYAGGDRQVYRNVRSCRGVAPEARRCASTSTRATSKAPSTSSTATAPW
jgi:pectinesterase